MFEVEFPRAIDIVAAAPFGELSCIVGRLSELAPLDLALSTFKSHDIHLGKIFSTFGLVYEA
jgi:hypothetical protein